LVEQAIAQSIEADRAKLEAMAASADTSAPVAEAPRAVGRDARVLVRKTDDGGRKRVYAAAGAVVVLIAAVAAAWGLGWPPFGNGAGSGDGDAPSVPSSGPSPATAPSAIGTDSLAAADTLASADSLGGSDDSTTFGPIGFNAVADTSAPVDSAVGPDTTAADAQQDTGSVPADTAIAPPADTAPAPTVPPAGRELPAVVVPPGYAIAAEIVVVQGLPVLSVAETSTGVRVTQQGEGGIELVLVAASGEGDAGPNVRDVSVTSQGDTAVGSARIAGYRIEARSLMAPDLLQDLLMRLMLARPIN
jgi:hypothetical protein